MSPLVCDTNTEAKGGLYARKKTGKVRAPGLQLPGCKEQQVLWHVL